VESALLAEAGFTANADILETPRGYAATLYTDWDAATFADFARPWRIVEPGYALKLFPCQYGTHFAVNAALDVAARIRDPQAIERVTLTTPDMPYVDKPAPRDGLDGKFSFQYVTACALLDGRVGIESFADARRFAPDMQAMLARIGVVRDPGIPGSFEHMHVVIEVTLAGGERLSARCDKPKGYVGTPVPEADHLLKVRDCLARGRGDLDVEAVIAACRGIESLDGAGIKRLMRTLRG
jgi:aconitate decarboxylase